ncbi:MAG: hypothetical protein M8352_08235 [ANME-2 cluster archaeon]|nr:hypothetical protein [ANME-2 cluster archaeon]
MRTLHKDVSGQAVPIDYILIFSMSVLFFGIMTLSFSSVVDNSTRQAVYSELSDVGNQISSGITDAYLSNPVQGKFVSVMDIPVLSANSEYFIDVTDEDPYGSGQKTLRLTSRYRDVTVFVPLSSIDELVSVHGSVSSSSGKIIITNNRSDILITQG